MSENQPYALWIIPTDEAYALTSGFIARLGRLYDLPAFEPHVTVLGGVRCPEFAEMRDLAESLAPFRIRLAREVEYREAYFRCLYLQAYKTDELGGNLLESQRAFWPPGCDLLSPSEPGLRGPARVEKTGDDRGVGADPGDRVRSARDFPGRCLVGETGFELERDRAILSAEIGRHIRLGRVDYILFLR